MEKLAFIGLYINAYGSVAAPYNLTNTSHDVNSTNSISKISSTRLQICTVLKK